MGCSPDTPDQCFCSRIDDPPRPLLLKFQDILSWCDFEEGYTNGCCYSIGDSYPSLESEGVTFEEYNCKLPDPEMVKSKPDLCKIPCSDSFPENCPCSEKYPAKCECLTDSTVPALRNIYEWCNNDGLGCCSSIYDDYAKYKYSIVDRKCKVLNQTMANLYPEKCSPLDPKLLNWRLPITSGATCFTSIPQEGGLEYVNQTKSLGNGFVCMNYFSWYEPLSKYVVVATTGDEELYASMLLYPNIYMNLSKCNENYCNNPAKLQQDLKSFQPEISIQSGPGLSCFTGIYPNVIAKFVYNADICIRYSFKPDYKSSLVTVYNGIPSSLLPQLKETLFAKNVTSCSTSDCNEIIVPPNSASSSSVLDPNKSKKLACFENIDSGGVVIAHPNPVPDPSTQYCLKVTSALNNAKMFFSASSYQAFSSFSKTSDFSVCNTGLCNNAESSLKNLKCYLTNPRNQTDHLKSDFVLPVDFCVKYLTLGGNQIYSGVTTGQLGIISSNPSKFKEVESCQTDFCLVP